MFVEPTPALPRDRRSRRAATVRMALPPLALGAVLATAVLAGAREPAASPGLVDGAASAEPAAGEAARNGPDRATPPAPFPSRVARLTVSTAAATLGEHRRSGIQGVVAVGAFLTLDPRLEGCARDDSKPDVPELCVRHAVLADDGRPRLALESRGGATRVRWVGDPGPHLHAVVPPGIALPAPPAPALSATDAARIIPLPVVVLGRFGDPRVPPCDGDRRHCGDELMVERVAWIGTEWQYLDLVAVPEVGGRPARVEYTVWNAARRALPANLGFLSQATLDRPALERVDPAAAAAIRVGEPGRVWYVRALMPPAPEWGPVAGPDVAWVVIDPTTRRVLASSLHAG